MTPYIRLQIIPEAVVLDGLVIDGGVPVELHAQLAAAPHPRAQHRAPYPHD